MPTEINWKERGVKNKKEAIKFLKEYQWSSLSTYLNTKNYPFIEKGLLSQSYEKPADWEKEISGWLPENGMTIDEP